MSAAYDCEICTAEDRKIFGCSGEPDPNIREIYPDGLWSFEPCIICNGENLECNECKGSNAFHVWSCPRALATQSAFKLLPYFYDWWYSLQREIPTAWPYPGGRVAQTCHVVQLFELLAKVKMNQEGGKDGTRNRSDLESDGQGRVGNK